MVVSTENENVLKLKKLVASGPQWLREEIDYWLEFEPDPDDEPEGYIFADAWERVEESISEIASMKPNQDVSKEEISRCRGQLKTMRLFLIEVGFYRPMTQNQIENTWCSSGNPWDFRLNGIPYECVSSWGLWTGQA